MIEEILDLDSASWDRPFTEKALISDFEEVESLAAQLRVKWKLGKDPIPDMTGLLEEHGIKVFVLPLPASVSGLTCLVGCPSQDTHVPVIVVNAGHNIERRRLTLAHELAHRLIDENSECNHEKAANRFAGAFLVPRDHLINEAGKQRNALGYRELIQLKHLFRISAAALLVRLEQTGIIEHSTLVYSFQTFAKGWRKKEPEPLEDCGVEVTNRFERLCYWALSEELISLPKAVELLRKSPADIQDEIRGPSVNAGHRQ
jgi:Zn-dependent peptidase ImmA (M78 family)